MATPTLVSRRCTRMPRGIPTSVKPKHANENAISRFIATRIGSVKFLVACQFADLGAQFIGVVGAGRRQADALLPIAQFVPQLPERHVIDFGFARPVGRFVGSRLGKSSPADSDDPRVYVTLRESNKCRNICLFVKSVSRFPLGASQGHFNVGPIFELEDHHVLQIAAAVFFRVKNIVGGNRE